MPKKLPKISIITPSLNQAKYIEQTIKSVLFQNYPYLEYIIIDGGSTDGTLDILKKYKNKLQWISEKDKGQVDAINKGVRLSSGDIIGYLNSDDILEPNCLFRISEFFNKYRQYHWVTGKCFIIDKNSKKIRQLITSYKNIFLKFLRSPKTLMITNYISQPATFWRRKVLTKTGLFNVSLHYSMDYDYWLRIWKNYELGFIDDYLASFRVHKTSKTSLNLPQQFVESFAITRQYSNSKILLNLHRFHDKIISLLYNTLST